MSYEFWAIISTTLFLFFLPKRICIFALKCLAKSFWAAWLARFFSGGAFTRTIIILLSSITSFFLAFGTTFMEIFI